MKGLRMFHQHFIPYKTSIWYTKDFKTVGEKEDSVIIFDSVLSVPAANYLRKKYPNLRIIYWFWNHINNINILNNLSDGIELWSYDMDDCEKYSLKYNSQFYFKELSSNNASCQNTPFWDFCFVGGEKGRSTSIAKCRELIEKAGFTSKFIVVSNERKKRLQQLLPYSSIVEIIQKSRCIVDIVQESQKGMTLRPLEAMFHHKKLITNSESIRSCDFFSPQNIGVFTEMSTQDLLSFMSSPLTKCPCDIIEKYTFQNWITRF